MAIVYPVARVTRTAKHHLWFLNIMFLLPPSAHCSFMVWEVSTKMQGTWGLLPQSNVKQCQSLPWELQLLRYLASGRITSQTTRQWWERRERGKGKGRKDKDGLWLVWQPFSHQHHHYHGHSWEVSLPVLLTILLAACSVLLMLWPLPADYSTCCWK